MTTRYEICPAEEIPPGERKIVEVAGLSIGVFNIDGEFYAMNNVCPHQLAPLCEGEVTGMTTAEEVGEYNWSCDGEIVKCPWHHWEFDITTGESVFNPHKIRTRTYNVELESADRDEADEAAKSQAEEYGTKLAGDEPPLKTYDVGIEQNLVVIYI